MRKTGVYRAPTQNRRAQLPRWTSLMCEEVMVCGRPTTGIVDTGASASILTKQVIAKYGLLSEVQAAPTTSIDVADGAKVPVLGQLRNVPIGIGGHILKVDVLVTEALSYDLLLGMDYLVPLEAVLDLASRKLLLPDGQRVALECGNGFVEVRMLRARRDSMEDSAFMEAGTDEGEDTAASSATRDSQEQESVVLDDGPPPLVDGTGTVSELPYPWERQLQSLQELAAELSDGTSSHPTTATSSELTFR